MAHGILHGWKHGWKHGQKHGGLTLAGGMAGVAQDATSGIFCPANSAQWLTTLAAAGLPANGPVNTWLFQEPSGNLADSVGSATLTSTLTVYGASVVGWSRKAVGPADLSASTEKATNTTTSPNAGTTSTLLLTYVALPAGPAGNRDIFGQSAGAKMQFLTTGRLRLFTSVSTAFINSSALTVQPAIVKVDLTGSTIMAYSSQEKVTGTFATPASLPLVIFGSLGTINAPCLFLYGAEFSGVGAEINDAQVKSLLQTLGWTIPWT